MRPLVTVGDIVGVHGVKGAVKVRSRSAEDSIFRAGSRVFIKDHRGREAAYEVVWARPYRNFLRVCFAGITDRSGAEGLVGGQILVWRDALPAPEDGEYYWSDLIGLSVESVAGHYLGLVEEIIATGSNDVYVVRDGNRETLVPALERVVKEIDLAKGRMRVELPEGL